MYALTVNDIDAQKPLRDGSVLSSGDSGCSLCEEYYIPNETTRKAIAETEGSLTFADANSAFAFLMGD